MALNCQTTLFRRFEVERTHCSPLVMMEREFGEGRDGLSGIWTPSVEI